MQNSIVNMITGNPSQLIQIMDQGKFYKANNIIKEHGIIEMECHRKDGVLPIHRLWFDNIDVAIDVFKDMIPKYRKIVLRNRISEYQAKSNLWYDIPVPVTFINEEEMDGG